MSSTTTRQPIIWDIDHYLNPYIPRPRLHLLPRPISHFLGHRSNAVPPVSQPLIWLWSFLGAVIGLSLASLLFRIPYLIDLSSQSLSPTSGSSSGHLIILGSLGASAILEYNTITSPLAQPRNAIIGQGLSATIGVGMLRLFQMMPAEQQKVEDLRWLAGALAVGISSAVMGMTKTVYPPAGATALLAATSQQVGDLGWMLIPVAMGASAIMVTTALIVNNIQRQFPVWWWTELPLASPTPVADEEKASESRLSKTMSNDSEAMEKGDTLHLEYSKSASMEDTIAITSSGIHVPEYIQLSTEEFAFLEVLKSRFELPVQRRRHSNDTYVGSI